MNRYHTRKELKQYKRSYGKIPVYFLYYDTIINSVNQKGFIFYLQLQGTTMGSPAAPSYANICKSMFETQYVQCSLLATHIKKWVRYVDNVFILWRGS